MNEKIYRTMGSTGDSSLVLGIVVLISGITAGILLIIHGAKLLKKREHLVF